MKTSEPPAAARTERAPAPSASRHSSQPLQVLLVEDSENDAMLLELELERAGYAVACKRVETSAAMTAALHSQIWDLAIADYLMPHFNGLEALGLVKSLGLDLPFIIVSGHITDDTAVAAMKAGAHDYVMKDNLARLGPAVQRELREAEVRSQRRLADQRLKAEQVFRQAIENSVPSGIAAVDLEGRQTYVNPAFCAMVGWSERELIGMRPPFAYWPADQVDAITEALGQVVASNAPPAGLELRFRRRTGERLDVLMLVTPLRDAFGNVTGWVSSFTDITERKRAEARLAAEHSITRLLAQAQSLEEAAPGILDALLESLEMDLGALWTLNLEQQVLLPLVSRARTLVPSARAFAESSHRASLPPGAGLAGRVWQSKKPLWLEDLLAEDHFERGAQAVKAGLHTAMAFPIQSAGHFFGVLEFFALPRLACDQALVNMMTAIGSEIGQFLERRSAEAALRRAHDELEIRVQQRTAELKSANSKLHASIAERKRLENELLEITEKERRRIGLDLHDDLGQKLSGIALMTKGLELKLSKDKAVAGAAQDAARIHTLIQAAMTHASDVAHDLATLDLAKKELTTALNDLAAHAKELFHINCRFTCTGTVPALEPGAVNQLYKIAQEALTNAIKHGKADRVAISLTAENGKLILAVQNNGLPFPDLHSHTTGMGLRIMNYRASLIGATLEITGLGSHGTRLTCTLPNEAKK